VRLCRARAPSASPCSTTIPEHDDDLLDGIAREVEKALPGSFVARDGLTLNLD
jgi:hypothetical protein